MKKDDIKINCKSTLTKKKNNNNKNKERKRSNISN